MITASRKRSAMLIVAVLMIVSSWFSLANSSSHSVQADGLDPASKILCKFEDGENLVRFHSTDYFHYMFRSKSAVTSVQPVDSSWLNKLLTLAGHDFNKANEAVLGRSLRPTEMPETSIDEANKSAQKVSAFDRFGVAGLKWSSYQGEWKYYHINPCSTQDQVSPTTFGTFYKDRLEPQTTHNGVSTSIDPRSVQFNKGVGSTLATAFTDTISNALFSITKGIVTLTIVFVGLAFTDITLLLGLLDDNGESGSTASGIFTSLFDGIFSGFVLFAAIFTAIYMIYKGLIKRELRFALNTLIKTILIFIVAVIMASNPSFWVGAPNKIATYGQALVLNSMSSIYEKDNNSASLCITEVASINDGVDFDLSKPSSFKSNFEKTNENMRSMIACNMWQTLLLEPWVRGQFGTTYDELDNEKLKNNNELWAGTAAVPLGGDKWTENWALYHVSTQTNAHAPTGEDSIPIIVNGVNSDWWRIVDAMSDYEEEIEYELDEHGVEHEFNVPVEKATTEHWQSWVGNNRTERFGIAFISIIFGIVGSAAPLVFGVTSAVLGLGITLLMMTAPVFLLMGVWGGRGDSIFFGWLSALLNTIIKKVIAGLLLVLSLSFSMAIMKLIGEIGFIKSFILMVVVTALLVKNKDVMLNMMANINFGGAFDPRVKFNQFLDVQKRTTKEVSRMTAASVGGGFEALRTGQKFRSGLRMGAGNQLKSKLYTSSAGMNIIRQMEIEQGGGKISNHTCILCHTSLGVDGNIQSAYRDDHGNYYCVHCADEVGMEKLYEVIVGSKQETQSVDRMVANPDEVILAKDKRTLRASSEKSWISHRKIKKDMGFKKVNGNYEWNDDKVRDVIEENIYNVHKDFVVFQNVQMKYKNRANPPSPPEPLHEYIDLALINLAWADNRFDVIESTYKEAWKMWYSDNAQYIEGISDEEIESFVDEIDGFKLDIDEKEAVKLINDYYEFDMEVSDRANEQDVYAMRDGKMKLYNVDIDETNKRLND